MASVVTPLRCFAASTLFLRVSLRSSPSVTPKTFKSSSTRSSRTFLWLALGRISFDFPIAVVSIRAPVRRTLISAPCTSTGLLTQRPDLTLTLGPISLRDRVLCLSPFGPNIVRKVFLSNLIDEAAADAQAPSPDFRRRDSVESSQATTGTYLHDETGVGVRVVRLAHGRLRRSGADPRRARRRAPDATAHLFLQLAGAPLFPHFEALEKLPSTRPRIVQCRR